ncbi:hypothetical protein [Streptomonospora wellingtoniae]|uniref:DUF2269 domain-containing protein n=1 Tax=Streptomonospora wellingtoniae TaxID=3075544 RepID=A0ABU2KSE6_9ACTN|nr:hypothetical protein [Streptomonospora sp. DSM 45055]MDT0302209.1 hypothetical protein [Streptomonospora sp. DSM 45055]
MRLRPGLPRKAVLSLHVIASMGWLGVHAGVLTLVAAGTAADEAERAGALYGSAAMLGGLLVPALSLTALATGLTSALGTHWGLFRHYWVAAKLALTAVLVAGSNLRLMPATADLAEATRGGTVPPPFADRLSLVVALSVALSVLLAASLLSTGKPFGRIRPRRRSREEGVSGPPSRPARVAQRAAR